MKNSVLTVDSKCLLSISEAQVAAVAGMRGNAGLVYSESKLAPIGTERSMTAAKLQAPRPAHIARTAV